MTRSELIFGSQYTRGRDADLARATGVSVSTLRRWRADPDKIPSGKLRIILRIRRVPDDMRLRLLK